MSNLLDTNILSVLRKKQPDQHVAAWFAGVAVEDLFLSPLIIGEIHQGIARLKHRNTISVYILHFIQDIYRAEKGHQQGVSCRYHRTPSTL